MARISVPPEQLSRTDVAQLFERYARTHDPEDQEALVLRFLPLARHCARRYEAGGEREDLEQVAALALVKAVDRYDPARGIAFTTFAVPTILGELKRHFRDRGWSVRVPRSLQELAGGSRTRWRSSPASSVARRPPGAGRALRGDRRGRPGGARAQGAGAQRAVSLDPPVDGEDDAGATLGGLIGGEDDELRGGRARRRPRPDAHAAHAARARDPAAALRARTWCSARSRSAWASRRCRSRA